MYADQAPEAVGQRLIVLDDDDTSGATAEVSFGHECLPARWNTGEIHPHPFVPVLKRVAFLPFKPRTEGNHCHDLRGFSTPYMMEQTPSLGRTSAHAHCKPEGLISSSLFAVVYYGVLAGFVILGVLGADVGIIASMVADADRNARGNGLYRSPW
jgi:hypothetical protein